MIKIYMNSKLGRMFLVFVFFFLLLEIQTFSVRQPLYYRWLLKIIFKNDFLYAFKIGKQITCHRVMLHVMKITLIKRHTQYGANTSAKSEFTLNVVDVNTMRLGSNSILNTTYVYINTWLFVWITVKYEQ